MEAILALEDGTIWRGVGFGARATVCGEVCFNTSMTGYQEILTDPSYHGQIVTMTYPHIGNYGVNGLDAESNRPQVAGFVAREISPAVSNWRAEGSLVEYLERYGIPGIAEIDTRALVKKLRVRGVMNGALSTEGLDPDTAVARARSWHGIEGSDFVKNVTASEPYLWDPEDKLSRDFRLVFGPGETDPAEAFEPLPPAEIPVVAYDFGIKRNILRRLRQHGFRVEVVPAAFPAEEVWARRPAGVFLSNGPGDPAAVTYGARAAAELLRRGMPLFGICLGHQILCLALGARTFKLKFGHRGGNQPVKHLESGRVEITAQNHGFAVDPDSLPPEAIVNRVNLNDKTVEGVALRGKPAFSVQYHPEASPGPHDSTGLFAEFRQMIEASGS
ncbi:MAG: glutamine-hydrolyzing carbamoyl-phosphate synthase small subunit [Verrucomicrobia bacterium]|nr:glutamine-hydrolyzing carbamoyl-phosphate synthase small subunit [Verrucomicrobiota bacterium]